MSPPDEALGPLKRKDGEPTFDEPWQAQALAMADTLVRAGTFSAEQWADALGVELRERAPSGPDDDANAYYGAVVAALESLLHRSGAADTVEVETRHQQWKRAFLNTPHGKPVELSAGEG